MSLKLITFLGSTLYSSTTYRFGENCCESPFIQVALAHLIRPEEICVFVTDGTAGSKRRNWEGIHQGPDGKIFRIKGLKQYAENISNINFHVVDIPDGKNVEDIWRIFDIVSDNVNYKDRIIFDVTHSFRSIPIIVLACIQYLCVVKNVELVGVYYGAWEARGDDDIAPIIDLTAFVQLMDWSYAVRSFEETSDIVWLKKLLDAEALPRCKESKGSDKEAVHLREFGRTLDRFAKSLATCRCKDLYENGFLDALLENVNCLKKYDSIKVISPLLSIVESKIRGCKVDGSEKMLIVRRGFEAVKWCADHNQIQQAYTIFRENILTYICILNQRDVGDKNFREKVSGALQAKNNPSSDLEDCADVSLIDLPVEIYRIYDTLSKRRNDLNHAGITQPAKCEVLIDDIRRLLNDVLTLLEL